MKMLKQKTVADVVKQVAYCCNFVITKVNKNTYALTADSFSEIYASFYLYFNDTEYSILYVNINGVYPKKAIRIGECLGQLEISLNEALKTLNAKRQENVEDKNSNR